MLAITRGLPAAWTAQAKRAWEPLPAGSVSGKTVALIGLGEVGRSVAAACAALGMRVLGVRADPGPVPHVDEVRGPDGLEPILRAADFVVVAVPLTDRTRGMLGAREIAWMKRGAVLVNVARGGIVDETALAAALRTGKLGGAALDVFAEEPLPASSPLWSTPNLVVTPHIAGWVHDYLERAIACFLANLARVEDGLPPATGVDPARGY
jgi:phosphoglycerate dehydrogenase-like enzyme